MASDKRLNNLLRWSVENSVEAPHNNTNNKNDNHADSPTPSQLTPELMAALMGGPSEAELMKAAMEIITASDASLDDKLIAFDNFEQLIESLDNANNMANLGLWSPLLEQLAHDEAEMRKMAAWCIGTAVQNNEKTQERLVTLGGVPTLVGLATGTDKEDVRRKAVYALSSACRNYQPAMDVCVEELGRRGVGESTRVDAMDMDAVDVIMNGLRESAKSA